MLEKYKWTFLPRRYLEYSPQLFPFSWISSATPLTAFCNISKNSMILSSSFHSLLYNDYICIPRSIWYKVKNLLKTVLIFMISLIKKWMIWSKCFEIFSLLSMGIFFTYHLTLKVNEYFTNQNLEFFQSFSTSIFIKRTLGAMSYRATMVYLLYTLSISLDSLTLILIHFK